MQNQNVYWAFPGVLSNEFCDYVIKEGLKRNIITGETGGQRQKLNDNSENSILLILKYSIFGFNDCL